MTRIRKLAPVITAVAAALALGACGSDDGGGNPDSKLTVEQATAPLEGASPPLTAVRDQANQVLDEGVEGYETRVAQLKGTPVVVNKWASWCGPCRLEFPLFQTQAVKRAKEVAFLGVGSNDSQDGLETFLQQLPLPYPTYLDPDFRIAKQLGGVVQSLPSTTFYDSTGDLVFTHPGPYRSEEDLAADIDRYAQ